MSAKQQLSYHQIEVTAISTKFPLYFPYLLTRILMSDSPPVLQLLFQPYVQKGHKATTAL